MGPQRLPYITVKDVGLFGPVKQNTEANPQRDGEQKTEDKHTNVVLDDASDNVKRAEVVIAPDQGEHAETEKEHEPRLSFALPDIRNRPIV